VKIKRKRSLFTLIIVSILKGFLVSKYPLLNLYVNYTRPV